MPVQSTKIDDRKLRQAVERLRTLASLEVDVGSQGVAGAPTAAFRPRPNKDGTTPRSPGSVAQVLSYHELSRGGRTPRRSVIAATLADPATRLALVRAQRQIAQSAILTTGKITLDPLGKRAVEDMRRRIMSRIPPALGSWAIRAAGLEPVQSGKWRRKRGANRASLRDKRLIPLYDTRQIWQSLRYWTHPKRGDV